MVETERFPSLLQRTFGGTAPRVPGLAPEMAFALVDGLGPVGMHYVAITKAQIRLTASPELVSTGLGLLRRLVCLPYIHSLGQCGLDPVFRTVCFLMIMRHRPITNSIRIVDQCPVSDFLRQS